MRFLSRLLAVPSMAAATCSAAWLAGCAGMTAPTPALDLPQSASQIAYPATSKYQNAVLATDPIAYFPLNTAKQGSVIGGYSLSLIGGAKIAKKGAIRSERKANKYLQLANMAYAGTSLYGDIPGSGSMVAWVNLSELPSSTGNYFYISGESQVGNDFDLQFQNDNNLYFYTGAGENTEYVTDTASLVGHWNMIAVTYEGGSNGFRNIYWNGKLVAPFTGAVNGSPKSNEFSAGESIVFTSRYFQGGIDAVAVWDHALTASQIKSIYKAAGK